MILSSVFFGYVLGCKDAKVTVAVFLYACLHRYHTWHDQEGKGGQEEKEKTYYK